MDQFIQLFLKLPTENAMLVRLKQGEYLIGIGSIEDYPKVGPGIVVAGMILLQLVFSDAEALTGPDRISVKVAGSGGDIVKNGIIPLSGTPPGNPAVRFIAEGFDIQRSVGSLSHRQINAHSIPPWKYDFAIFRYDFYMVKVHRFSYNKDRKQKKRRSF
jgi:hypothetical protein